MFYAKSQVLLLQNKPLNMGVFGCFMEIIVSPVKAFAERTFGKRVRDKLLLFIPHVRPVGFEPTTIRLRGGCSTS